MTNCRIGTTAIPSRRAPTARTIHVLLTIALLVPVVTEPACAEDTVVVSRTEGRTTSRRKGTILDFTGQTLTLELPGGRAQQIPSSRVLSYETDLVADQQNADQLFTEGRYADALAGYQRALGEERRTWMRRRILAQTVWCYRNLEQIAQAVDAFLLIVKSDSATQWYGAIPLAWKPRFADANLQRRATSWMESERDSAAALIGASWLLSTSLREKSLATFKRLSNDADTTIAQLAAAQLWRAEIVNASVDDVVQWQRQVKEMDRSLSAGPFFVIGQALARHGQHAKAALSLLRVPVLYPENRDLAAEALLAAGEQLEKAGDHHGARTVYRELIERHKQHVLVPLAEQRLAKLPSE